MTQTFISPFDKDAHAMIQPIPQQARFSGLGRALTALAVFTLAAVPALAQQKTFPTPEAAAEALGAAVQNADKQALADMLGPDYHALVPPAGDAVRSRFLAAWAKMHSVIPEGDAARIAVGDDGWTLPIPLTKTDQGWHFDMAAGAEEIRVRRIGHNELAAMQVALAYFDAQKEYAERDRDGDGVLQYAAKFESEPGKQDGLYWPSQEGEAPSPLGPLVAKAKAEGAKKGEGYHGYRYKILTAQGQDAPGGAQDFIVKGRMIGGFALLAWPVEYGETGVMTFMVSHDGVIYEQDLGSDTEAAAARIKAFNPDAGWKKADDPS